MKNMEIVQYLLVIIVFAFASVYGFVENRKKEEAKRKELERRRRIEAKRRTLIESLRPDWGDVTCDLLMNKKVVLGMTQDMVVIAWGRPSDVDQQQVTEKWQKERWVYGRRRVNASYVSFKDGLVTAIKQTGID